MPEPLLARHPLLSGVFVAAGLLVLAGLTAGRLPAFTPIGLVFLAGAALSFGGARHLSSDRRLAWIVGGSYLVRSALAISLYVASAAYLPVFVSVQLGGGFWNFAPDAQTYHAVALALQSEGARSGWIPAADTALARRADQVFVASPALLEAKRSENPATAFAPHGVDAGLFARAADPATRVPERAAALPHPVVGFFGLLGDWIDVGLLAHLARARPQWTLLVVGGVATDVARLAPLPNVVLAGAQPYDTLPAWARAFDVAVIPYRMNRQVRHANPLKLREYLATGKPVVSVPTPEVERFAAHVRMARTPDEFLRAVEQSLEDDDEPARAARMRAVRDMSWETRLAQVLELVCAGLARKRNGGPAISRPPTASPLPRESPSR